jgi:hypothetical protein
MLISSSYSIIYFLLLLFNMINNLNLIIKIYTKCHNTRVLPIADAINSIPKATVYVPYILPIYIY